MVTMPILEDIVQVEFWKGHCEMFFKTTIIHEKLIQCGFLINKFSVQNEKLKVSGRLRGIPEKKRDGILGCLKGVSQSKHLFWQSLPINDDSKDLGENLID